MDWFDFTLGSFSTPTTTPSQGDATTVGIILLLIQLEITLLINFMSFIAISNDIDDIIGEIFGLYILVVGACETALGLSLLVAYYRLASNLRILL